VKIILAMLAWTVVGAAIGLFLFMFPAASLLTALGVVVFWCGLIMLAMYALSPPSRY
jgi:hypothetical protein